MELTFSYTYNSTIFFFFSTLNSNPSPINVEWRQFPHMRLFPLLVLNFFSELTALVLSIKRASSPQGQLSLFIFMLRSVSKLCHMPTLPLLTSSLDQPVCAINPQTITTSSSLKKTEEEHLKNHHG